MAGYIFRRLVWALAVLLAVGVLTFLLTFVVPNDPARTIAGIRASPEDVQRIRHALGLDEPVLTQLGGYLTRVVQGDFGHSYRLNRPVLPLILERFPATLQLALGGIVVQLLIGIPLGVVAATAHGSRRARAIMLASVVLVAAPSFWVGYLLLNLLAFQPAVQLNLAIFPIGGYQPFDLRYLFLPAVTLGLGGSAYYIRLMRTGLLEELHRQYVITARAKGAAERRVVWRHAVRNAIPPVLTQLGLDMGFFLGGVVVIEQVFSWPGIGKLAVDSIFTADIPLLLGTVLFATTAIVVANLVVDVAYAFANPRLRRS